MALQAKMLLVVCVLSVTWLMVQGEPNPVGDPLCNGHEFRICTEKMQDESTCKARSSWVSCLQSEFTAVKQRDCNDQQRKSARRLVKIYTYLDDHVCVNDSLVFAKDGNRTACWDTIRFRILNDLFGYGTLPCKISEWSTNKTLDDLKEYCNGKEAVKFYYNVREEGECTDHAATLVTSLATALLPMLVSLLTFILWQR